MESGVFLPCLDQFMLSPLVTWVSNTGGSDFLTDTEMSNLSSWILFVFQVKTFVPQNGGMHLDLPDLLEGSLLNEIMMQM